MKVLQWIVDSDLCSEATALMIFWRAQPEDFTKYSWNAKRLPHYREVEVFDLIRTIVANFKKGFYKKTDITYDPKQDMSECDRVPEIMLEVTSGEEPYIYYDEKEVTSWFGEYLDNRLFHCTDAIELYNIAALQKGRNIIEIYEKILNHPFCDKGIALLCFWRLRNYTNLYAVEKISKDIIRKVENNAYKEVLKYDPLQDSEIKIKQEVKWTIPDAMKKAVNTPS